MGKEQSIAPKENIISIPTNFIPAQELVCVCVRARARAQTQGCLSYPR